MKGFEELIQNHWSRSFPSPNFVRFLFAVLIFPLSGVETTFYNNFTLISSLPGLWDRLGKDKKLPYGAGESTSEIQVILNLQGRLSTPLHTPLPTRFISGQSCQLDICLSLPLSQSLPTIQIKGAHTWQPLLWVAAHPATASPVWASLRFSQAGKENQEEGLEWILWQVIHTYCKQWSLTCFWGKPPYPLMAAHISFSLQDLVLLGKLVTK